MKTFGHVLLILLSYYLLFTGHELIIRACTKRETGTENNLSETLQSIKLKSDLFPGILILIIIATWIVVAIIMFLVII